MTRKDLSHCAALYEIGISFPFLFTLSLLPSGLTTLLIVLVAVCGLVLYALHRHRLRQLLHLERMRARIAMDLHDDIGANLSSIAMLSEVIQRELSTTSPEVGERLARIAGIARESVDSLSDIVWAINPEQDHLADLTQRMCRVADDLCAARDLSFSFQAEVIDQGLKLNIATRRELLLIFKECINNIAKHSNCTQVDVVFQQQGDCLLFTISDNGNGIDLGALQNGNGLSNMRRRAVRVGGSLKITSLNDQGVRISLRLPLQQAII